MTTQVTHLWLTTTYEFTASCGIEEHIYIQFLDPDVSRGGIISKSNFQYAACPEGIAVTDDNIRDNCPTCGAPAHHIKEWVRPNMDKQKWM